MKDKLYVINGVLTSLNFPYQKSLETAALINLAPMWSIFTEYVCTSITISDIVLYIIPVIFRASQPLGVVSCWSLHVMLVLCYEFVPWSPCLPSSTESMPVVSSETAFLAVHSSFYYFWQQQAGKATEAAALEVTGRWGKPWIFQPSPLLSLRGLLPQGPAQVSPLQWRTGPMSIFHFFSWEPMALLPLESNKGFYLTWSLLFCDQSVGCTFREINVLRFGFVFLKLCSRQLCCKL